MDLRVVEGGTATYFDATFMHQVGKDDMRKLPADEDGMVLLNALIKQIRAAK